jgi:hypothetical protein
MMNNRKLTMSLAFAALLGIGLTSPAMADGKRHAYERGYDQGYHSAQHHKRRHAQRHDRKHARQHRYGHDYRHGHRKYARHHRSGYGHRHARQACKHWSHKRRVHHGYGHDGWHVVIRSNDFGLRF